MIVNNKLLKSYLQQLLKTKQAFPIKTDKYKHCQYMAMHMTCLYTFPSPLRLHNNSI